MKHPKTRRFVLGLPLGLAALLFGVAAPARADIGYSEAGRIALQRVPGVIEEIERKRDTFEVEVRSKEGIEYELIVSAADGSVLAVHVDD